MSRSTKTARRPRLCRLEDRLAPATYTVTNTNDSGSGSLRSAISSANSSSSDDTIAFSPAVFNVPRTITLTSGELNISDTVHVQGPGAGLLTVSGGAISRVFDVSGTGTPQVIFSDLRIANGKVAGSGAGVRNQGEIVSLIGCLVSSNTATGASGGGVSSIGGTLILSGCTVSGNSAGSNGGGLDANSGAAVTVTTTTVSGNTAGGQGAGIGVGSSSLFLERSTVSGNAATGSGGGLYFAGTATAGGLTLRNSTLSGNSAGVQGGAVRLSNFGGTLLVQNSTLTANSAKSSGGGIHQSGGTGAITVESSIISGNTSPSANDVSNSAHPATVRFSALGSTSGFTFSDLGGNLPVGADLKLTALISGGGPTKTHGLLVGSPAIDAGSNPAAALYDQRASGYPRVVNARADIGASESQYLVVTNANNSGPGSLRQAVADANAITTIDAVTFDPVFFATPRTVTLTGGEILITDFVVIHGPGAGLATISGNNASRVLRVEGSGSITATVNGLTLANGKGSGGGAVYNVGEALTLRDCVLANNFSFFGGGAVLNVGGSLTLERCGVVGNTASANGGGVDANSSAAVTLRDSTFENNFASGQGGAAGIGSSTLLIDRCTLSGNQADNGGGLYFAGAAGSLGLVVRNSTLSGNKVTVDGGAIHLANFTGTLTLRNSTVVSNSAAGNGGGIDANPAGAATVVLQSAIVQANTAKAGPDVFTPGTTTAQSSALGSINGITTLTNLGGNLIGQDLKLGPLADNGGPTKTHALLPGSPAIDAGYNPGILPVDQRGLNRIAGKQTDIGAFEHQPPPPAVVAVQVNDGTAQRSRVTSLTVTFSEPVSFPGGVAAAFGLARVSPAGSVNLAFAQAGSTVTITFAAGGAVVPEAGSLPDGRYDLTVIGNQVANGFGLLMAGDHASPLHRLFGDADGDADVDALDYAALRGTFGGAANLALDFDGDGDVDAADYGAFRPRFGSAV